LLIPKTDSTRSTTPIPIKRKFALEKQGKELFVHLEWNWKISVPPKKMEVTQDSVWKEIPFDCSGNSIRFHSQDIKAGKLKIRYDTLRFFNQSTLRKDSIEISKPDFDPKGSVSGSVKTVSDIPIRVELLNSNKTVVASSTGKNFTWKVKPGKYTLLVFGDIDGDGFYTGGNKETRRKAEPLYMHPEPVELKPGWDLENILLSPGF
jgi:hypothetical protein